MAVQPPENNVTAEPTPTITFAVSTDGKIKHINFLFETATGWSCEEWTGKPIEDAFFGESKEQLRALLSRVQQSRSPRQTQIKLRKRNHEPLLVAVTLIPQIFRRDGEIEELWLIASPTEAGLREQSILAMGAFTEASPIGFAYWDRDFKLKLANPAFGQMFGPSISQKMGDSLAEILPHLSPVLKPLFGEIVHRGRSTVSKNVFAKRNGDPQRQFFSFSCSAYRDADGEVSGIVTFVQDITSQKAEAEKSAGINLLLREQIRDLIKSATHSGSQARVLAGILEAIEEGIIVCFEDSSAIVNPAAQRILNLHSRHQNSVVELDCLPSVTEARFLDALPILSAIQGQTLERTEIYISANGDSDGIWLCCAVVKLESTSLEKKGAVITLEDITKRRKNEFELKSIAEGLERSNQELSQFAYVASHDLKEPLRAINSYVQLLRRRYHGKFDEKADQYMNHAMQGSQRMVRLIDDLLAYCKIGKERVFNRVDCDKIMEEILTLLQVAIEETKATVKWTNLPVVIGDRVELTQLLQNLVSNAIKFCGDTPPLVEIAATKHNGKWFFNVKDNGIGIAPEFQDRIFLIFNRLHRNENISGTGLGLAICKKVVDDHGGQIWVESLPGQGSSFHFCLPAN